ncbi:MAG TPA: TraB/VirB10 family protein, partial [Planctomycetota bacterium]|nr:TraB/VirB10 family protein [Planctomycetota bacterium]
MALSVRPTFLAFLIRTKLGRMILLATVLGLSLVLVPIVSRHRSAPEAASPAGGTGKAGEAAGSGSEFPPSPTGINETITLGQKYDALISRYGGDLSSTKTDLEATRKELEMLRAALKDDRSAQEKEKRQLGDVLKQLKDGLSPGAASSPVPEGPGSDPKTRDPGPRGPGSGAGGGLRMMDLGPATPRKKERDLRPVRIPAAAGGQATLLNGTFGPITGEPSPVRLRFDAAIQGPHRARIPLQGAYLIGKATGDANSCRVSIQIERLSTVKDNGEALETKALGYVVAEDGLEGVPGTYEWRAWELAPLALGTGAAQGLSGALAQSQTTTMLSPLGGATSMLTGDSLKLAGYQAAGGASGKLGEIVAERMKEIRPAVSTPAGRRVTVVFLDGLTLEGLSPQEIDEG